MLELSTAVGFVVQGLRSNLYGLACPFYCASPGIGSLVACYLAGVLSGGFFCAWISVRFDLFPAWSSTDTHHSQPPPGFSPGFQPPLDGPDLLCLPTCMSSHGADIEVSLDIAGLRVTVRGDSAKVADFVQFVGSFTGQRARSPTNSVGSFELLCEPPAASSAPSGRVGLETREQISASFAACPDRLLSWGNKLSGANLAGRDRASRAWVAGLWARAVLDRRVHSPNRTPPLDLRSRFYAVARADSVDCPVVFRSSTSYWRAIGSLEGSSSVSQSFPSEAECRIYLLAAGFSEDNIQFLP